MAVYLSPVGGVAAQFFDNNGTPLAGGLIYTYAAGTSTPATTYTSSNGLVAHSNPIVLDASGRVPTGEIWLSDALAYKFVIKTAQDVLIASYDNVVGINSNFIAYTAQQEIQTATAGQTVFNLATMSYQPGTNNLSVFVDGVNQYGPGAQYAYVETDSDTVTFVSGLHIGASVKFTTATPVASAVVNAENVAYDPPFFGAVGTNVEAKLAQTISVKDFGAVGDGVTDDTDAFTAAIAAIDDLGGGTLYAPQTYNVPNGIIITTSNFVLDGQGTGKILSDGSPENAIYVNPALDNITIKDISLQIPTSNLRSAGGMCLLFGTGCSNIKVLNVNTLGGVAGIWTVSGTNVLVQGCYVDTPKADGIHFGQGSKQCKAIGNTVIGAGDDSFATTYYTGYAAGRPTDIVFANNIAKNSVWGFGVSAYGADRVTITGNEFYNMAEGGVQVTNASGTTQSTDVVIANNNIDTVCRADYVPNSYWYGTSPSLDPAVTSQLQESAIAINADRVQCVGNRINTVNSATGVRRYGCTLYSSDDQVSITSNYFTNVNGDGINTFTQAISQVSICNNSMDQVLGVGIRLANNSYSFVSVNNNSFGYGQTLSSEPYMIKADLSGTISGKVTIVNNTSSGDRGISVTGGLPADKVIVNNNT